MLSILEVPKKCSPDDKGSREITNNKRYKASCDKALSCRRETIVGSQGNSVWNQFSGRDGVW